MKKIYQTPFACRVEIDPADVLTASPYTLSDNYNVDQDRLDFNSLNIE